MSRPKERIVVVLITVAVGSGILVVCSAQSTNNRTESEKSTPTPDESHSEVKVGEIGLFTNDSNISWGSGFYPNKKDFFFRTLLAVLFVVFLSAAAIYVSKKLLPQIAKLPGKEIRVVETVHLGPRKAVHVLEIGNRRLLIGSTNENVTKLADITNSCTDLPSQDITYNEE
jgi:flagellar biosynthetic protein FliO